MNSGLIDIQISDNHIDMFSLSKHKINSSFSVNLGPNLLLYLLA